MKKVMIIAVISVVCLLLTSCSTVFDSYEFTQHGLSITLDSSFIRDDSVEYTACYRSSVATVFLLREEFSDTLSSELSLSNYTDLVLSANSLDSDVEEKDGYCTFHYEYALNDNTFHNFVCLYKTSDAFWIVRFECLNDYYSSLESSFQKWASSVKDVKGDSATTEQG